MSAKCFRVNSFITEKKIYPVIGFNSNRLFRPHTFPSKKKNITWIKSTFHAKLSGLSVLLLDYTFWWIILLFLFVWLVHELSHLESFELKIRASNDFVAVWKLNERWIVCSHVVFWSSAVKSVDFIRKKKEGEKKWAVHNFKWTVKFV